MRRAMAGLLGVVMGSLLARPALASEGTETAALEWQVDADLSDCMTEAEFSALAAERMGRPLFRADGQSDRIASVRLSRAPAGLAAIVKLRDRAGALLGTRELRTEGPSCADLVDHTILVVGLMLDYSRSGPAKPRKREPIKVPETVRPEPWRVRAGATAEAGRGLLPGTSLAAGLDLAVITPFSWAFEVSAMLFRAANVPDTDQVISTGAVRLAICPLALEPGRLRFEACLAQQTALLKAEDSGFPRGRTQEHVSVAAGPRIRLDVSPWGPVFAGVAAGVEVPISRVAFNDISLASSPEETYRVAPLFGYGALVLGVEVP